jgi:hypothetical protein
MKPQQHIESLAMTTMASGHMCLNLTERVSWENFPGFAESFIRSVEGSITQKSDGPDLRLWQVNIHGHLLRLVFDDFPVMVSLESSDDKGDDILKQLYRTLKNP